MAPLRVGALGGRRPINKFPSKGKNVLYKLDKLFLAVDISFYVIILAAF